MSRLRLAYDTEGDGLLDETTKLHCISVTDLDTGTATSYADQPGYVPMSEGLALLAEADEVWAHNHLKHDRPVIAKLYPEFRWKQGVTHRDSIVCTRLIWPELRRDDAAFIAKNPKFPRQLTGRHSLEAWGWRLGHYKGDYKGGWERWSPEMHSYMEQDTVVLVNLIERILSKNYAEEAIQLEHDFQEIIFEQERHGFPFDEKRAASLWAEMGDVRTKMAEDLRTVFHPWWARGKVEYPTSPFHTKKGKLTKHLYTEGHPWQRITWTEFNPNSRDHIAERLKAIHGWEAQEFTPEGSPKIDETVLAGLSFPEAKPLSHFLTIQKRIGQLAEGKGSLLKSVKKDGRIHGRVDTNGAATGRCTHSSPNISQVPAVRKLKDDTILMGLDGFWGYEMRDLFYAPDGWKMVGGDASGIELRLLAHFMAKYDGGAYVVTVTTGDPHELNRAAAGFYTRKGGKGFIYAFIYGAGGRKLGLMLIEDATMAGQEAPDGDPADIGRKLIGRFLRKVPALNSLKKKVGEIVKARGFLTGLDGRRLQIRSVHSALNTLLQSAGAVVMKKATVLLHKKLAERGWAWGRDFWQAAHVHDEVQIIAREEIADDIGKLIVASIIEAGEHFKLRCPLDGGHKVGRTWAETH